MDAFSWSLLLSVSGVALAHTLLGPDHYLPFVALAGARGWSRRRAAAVTAACGAAHVAGSLFLGAIALLLGAGVGWIETAAAARAPLAAWALLALGLAYGTWGMRRALRRSGGIAPHRHGDRVHVHRHGDRPHDHDRPDSPATVWALLLVFVLGPCEPLVPLFVLPASRGRWGLALAAAAAFAVVTLATMVAATLTALAGARRLPLGRLERWGHAVAGGIVASSGLAVLLLGL